MGNAIFTHVPSQGAAGQLGHIPLRLADFHLGSTPPTANTVGTTPAIGALRFDATAETANIYIAMPPDWDKAQNCAFELHCALTTTEDDADAISWDYNYVAIQDRTTGQGATQTSTGSALGISVTTANGLATGDVYVLSKNLVRTNAQNGWSVGDATVAFQIEFHLTNLTGVAAIDLLGGRLTYTKLY